jgi:hypothetical protein
MRVLRSVAAGIGVALQDLTPSDVTPSDVTPSDDPPKRPIGFVASDDKGKKAQARRKG